MRHRADLAAIALIAAAVIRIAATFTLYSATVDEPMHVSAGLQLYTQHDYSYQPENPPLPRLVFALAPWLGGMEFDPGREVGAQLAHVFYSKDRYKTNLVLARSGNLLFFVLAAAATWCWGRRELGAAGGLLTAVLFTLQPIVTGYSGLATHDAAATAGVAVSLLVFTRWLDVPSTRRATAFGAAFAFAILCKFSCIGYVPAACLAMYLVRIARDAETRAAWRRIAPSFGAALITCLALVWAGYGFNIGRLSFLENVRDVLDDGAIGRLVTHHPSWPLPAKWFFLGIAGMVRFDRMDFFSYLFGEISAHGWRYYFPVAVALKSTLASLVLGLGALLARRMRVAAEALAAALAILAVSMPSHLDLGVRYVLPLYVPLSVAGAATALALLRHQRLRIAAFVLLAWHCIASLTAIPDAFPYFNEIAARRPWLYLLDSNLEWGQDVLRLKSVVRANKIQSLGVAMMGWNDYDRLGFPPTYELQRDTPTHGWAAVGEHFYWFVGYQWLHGRRYQRVGKSIRLYYIP
jgi:4-amino-4-deoxy-L-arabinose transferase-like glycosyltransferase